MESVGASVMRTFSQEQVDRYARELQYEADAEAARRAQRANGPDVDVKPGGEKAAEQFYTAGDLQWMEFPRCGSSSPAT